jgi:hypothetical protein
VQNARTADGQVQMQAFAACLHPSRLYVKNGESRTWGADGKARSVSVDRAHHNTTCHPPRQSRHVTAPNAVTVSGRAGLAFVSISFRSSPPPGARGHEGDRPAKVLRARRWFSRIVPRGGLPWLPRQLAFHKAARRRVVARCYRDDSVS